MWLPQAQNSWDRENPEVQEEEDEEGGEEDEFEDAQQVRNYCLLF